MHLANDTYLWVREPGKVRVQVELDAFGGPRQRDPSDQEDQKHNVGEWHGDIYNLSCGLGPLPDTEVADGPGCQETQGQLPAEIPNVLNPI